MPDTISDTDVACLYLMSTMKDRINCQLPVTNIIYVRMCHLLIFLWYFSHILNTISAI